MFKMSYHIVITCNGISARNVLTRFRLWGILLYNFVLFIWLILKTVGNNHPNVLLTNGQDNKPDADISTGRKFRGEDRVMNVLIEVVQCRRVLCHVGLKPSLKTPSLSIVGCEQFWQMPSWCLRRLSLNTPILDVKDLQLGYMCRLGYTHVSGGMIACIWTLLCSRFSRH